MAGDGDEPTLDPRTKEMIEGFLGVPLDKNHEFWNPPPLTPEQEAALEDVKRRAEACVGLDGFAETLLHRIHTSSSSRRAARTRTPSSTSSPITSGCRGCTGA